MNLKSLRELLIDQLEDIHSAETQLTKALPKMAKSASSETLVKALNDHLAETNHQIGRLDQIAAALGVDLSGKKCKAMQGLVKEGSEALDCSDDERIVDAAIIAAAQRVEHYEVSAYGTAATMAGFATGTYLTRRCGNSLTGAGNTGADVEAGIMSMVAPWLIGPCTVFAVQCRLGYDALDIVTTREVDPE